jgi:hypothetical protein
MSRMKKRLPAFLLLALACGAALGADDALIARCRAIANSAERLACYDAIALPASPSAARPAPSFAPPKAGTAPATPPAAALPLPPPPPGAPAAQPQQTEAQFGMEHKAYQSELGSVRSKIAGRFEGWSANSQIALENGMVWQVIDNTSRYLYLDNPAVTVKRGALGSFFLDIEGTNHMPRVRRVK